MMNQVKNKYKRNASPKAEQPNKAIFREDAA